MKVIKNKYSFFLILFFVFSCSNKNNYCVDAENFDLKIISSEINKINEKTILNKIINESNIKYDVNSNFLISIQVNMKRNNSLISTNNTAEIENINFNVKYEIIDKINKIILDKGRIIIVDNIHISDERFANFATENYVMENFARNLAIKLENKIKILKNNKKCKKIHLLKH